MWNFKCGECGYTINKWEKFCKNCWAELLWDNKNKKWKSKNLDLDIKTDFIQRFFEKNSSSWISKIGDFLFCNKNRISWKQAFVWYLRLRLICWLSLLPLKIITLISWDINIISYIWLSIIAIFFLIMYVKQNISRLHDVWRSGWLSLLTINPTFFIILLFIPWNSDDNSYWKPNILKQGKISEEELKKFNKKTSLIRKIPLILIWLIALIALIGLINM